MNKLITLVAATALAAPAFSQAVAGAPDPCLHVRTSFDVVVHAPYARTAPLFGPNGERAWAGKHWNPEFVYPQPARDVEGAVFTVQHGPYSAVWVTTLFDLDARHFQYVYFLTGLMVTVIDVHFTEDKANETGVHVVYTRTAVTPDGNQHVTAMSEGDKRAGAEWQKAINEYLGGREQPSKP
jgi:hypothetical protein